MNWWRQRNVRERLGLVAVGVLLAAVALFLALEPLLEDRRRLSGELPGLQADLAWMQAHAEQVETLRRTAATDAQEPAPSALSAARVEALLQEAGLHEQVAAMQPVSGQGIAVSFDEVGFAGLLTFTARLQDEGQARVTALRVSGLQDHNGQVTAQLTLLPR